MDLSKLPTDYLHKLLTLLGLVLLASSVAFPVGAYWKQELRRNSLQGEREQHRIARDSLVSEINKLNSDGRRLFERHSEMDRALQATIAGIRTEVIKESEDEDVDNAEIERLLTIQKEVLAHLEKIQGLETAGELEEDTIKSAQAELQETIGRLTEGLPDDVAEVAQLLISALFLANELDRLQSAAEPDKVAIKEKEKQVGAATEKLSEQSARVLDARRAQSRRETATVVVRSVEGLIHALRMHFNLLRLEHRSEQMGTQIALKVHDLNAAQVALDTKIRESEILARQTFSTTLAGIGGAVLGLVIATIGSVQWYRFDRLALRKRVLELLAAEADSERSRNKILVVG